MKTDITVSSTIGSIGFNYSELHTAIAEAVAEYKTAVYTDETIQQAKADRAYLRKQAETLEKRRKEIKKEFNKPYEEFEKQVKELVALIDEGTNSIDRQVKEYESKLRIEKQEKIRTAYLEAFPEDLREVAPLDSIYDLKWENQTTSMKQVMTDLVERSEMVRKDIECINGYDVPTEDIEKAIAVYKRSHHLSDALSKLNEIQQMRARIREEERKAHEQEMIEAAKKAEREKAEIEFATRTEVKEEPKEEPKVVAEESFFGFENFMNVPLVTQIYEITATDEKLRALEEYMVLNNITWR